MPEVAESCAGSQHPAASVRALGRLVLDVLSDAAHEWVPQPALARAPVHGGALIARSVEVFRPRSGRTGDRRAASRPAPEPAESTGDDPDTATTDTPDGVAADHAASWELVRRAQDGDGEAFGSLYDRYVDTVYRFVYYRVNDRALAEDFTSETFLRALRRIGTISYQGRDIGAWFVTIARNLVLDHVKSARNRLEVPTPDTIESREHAPSTETAVLQSLTTQHLMAAVARLGDEQRECVVLRFVQGFSVSETAAVMGKNQGAVKALQHRAVRKLAELVAPNTNEVGG